MQRHALTILFASFLFGCSGSTPSNSGTLLVPDGLLVDVDGSQGLLAYVQGQSSTLYVQPLPAGAPNRLHDAVTAGGFAGSSSVLTFDVDASGTGYGPGPRWLWQPGLGAPVQLTDQPVVDSVATPNGELILLGESGSTTLEDVVLVKPAECVQAGCPVTMLASQAKAPTLRAAAHAPAVAWLVGGQVGYLGPSSDTTASVSGISDAVDVNLSDDGSRLAVLGATTLTLFDVVQARPVFAVEVGAAASLAGFVDDDTPIVQTGSGTQTCHQGSCSTAQPGTCKLETTSTGAPKVWACFDACTATACDHGYSLNAFGGGTLFSGIGAPQFLFSDDATVMALYDPTQPATTSLIKLPMTFMPLGDGPPPFAFVPGTHTLVYFLGGVDYASLLASGDSGTLTVADLAGNFVARGAPNNIYYTGSDGIHVIASP